MLIAVRVVVRESEREPPGAWKCFICLSSCYLFDLSKYKWSIWCLSLVVISNSSQLEDRDCLDCPIPSIRKEDIYLSLAQGFFHTLMLTNEATRACNHVINYLHELDQRQMEMCSPHPAWSSQMQNKKKIPLFSYLSSHCGGFCPQHPTWDPLRSTCLLLLIIFWW